MGTIALSQGRIVRPDIRRIGDEGGHGKEPAPVLDIAGVVSGRESFPQGRVEQGIIDAREHGIYRSAAGRHAGLEEARVRLWRCVWWN